MISYEWLLEGGGDVVVERRREVEDGVSAIGQDQENIRELANSPQLSTNGNQ